MTVETKGSGGYVVYDAQGMVVHSSFVNSEPSVKLPAGGKIVFDGEAGTVFSIHMHQ